MTHIGPSLHQPVIEHEAATDPHTGYRLESADHTHQSTGAQAGKIDHGAALDGLADDDHTQYLKADGTRALAGALSLGGQVFSNGFEALLSLIMHNKLVPIETASGWTATNVGTGGSAQAPYGLYLYTGTTANSSALLYLPSGQFSQNANQGGNTHAVDWTKKLLWMFDVTRSPSEAETVVYVQLKPAITIGQMAGKGIGLTIANLAMSSESYGSARGSASLGVTMTSGYINHVAILHDPATPQILWYVNGALAYTETTSANIPQAIEAAADTLLVVSIANGASGGTSAATRIGNILIFQEQGG